MSRDIDPALVEKAAHALFAEEQCDRRQKSDVLGNWEGRLSEADHDEYRTLARAVLAAVLADVIEGGSLEWTARPGSLTVREVRRAPVVDREALARELCQFRDCCEDGCYAGLRQADALFASGAVQDAADVRRAVAADIAAAIRARAGRDMVLTHEAADDAAALALHIGAELLEVRIARDVGERDG